MTEWQASVTPPVSARPMVEVMERGRGGGKEIVLLHRQIYTVRQRGPMDR